jgi:hypothetical protein
MSDHDLEDRDFGLEGDEAQSAMPGKAINILSATQPRRSGAAIAPDHR